ncbi:MAG TPA: hypothetical protein VF659_09425 [Pyrinomonadaceae bacterium]
MTVEDATHEFIAEAVVAAEEGSALFGIELHDTLYTSKQERGVQIGDCESDVAPLPGGEGMQEFDAELSLFCFARIAGEDKSDRKAARNKARELMLAVAALFFDNTTMGGRVNDVLVRRCVRGYTDQGGDVFALAIVPLVVNGTGQLLDDER